MRIGSPLRTDGSRSARRTLLVCVVALMTVVAGCGGTGGNGASTGTGTNADTAGTTAADAGSATGTGTETAAGATTAGTTNETSGANDSMAGMMNASGPSASLRVGHMSPDAPNVDVAIDGRTVLSDVAFPEVSEYLSVPVGEHQLRVSAAGGSGGVLYNQSVTLEEGAYTVVAQGETTQGTRSSSNFSVALLNDSTAPSSENASVRLLHVSPGAGPVDVTVNETGQVLFDNVTFGNASEYVQVPADNYTLDVRQATADNDGPIVSNFTREFTAGTSYSVFAAGYVNPGRAPVGVSFEPIVVTDGLDATIRFANMAPDAANLEVSVNGQSIDSALPYQGQTEYFTVPAGNRTVTITAANASEPLSEEEITLNASTNYTVVATGERSDDGQAFRPVVLNDDLETPNASSARVRLVHAAPDAPPIDVESNASGRTLFDGLAYANATNYTTVPAGNYTFEAFVATQDDMGDTIATFRSRPLSGGTSYTLFAAGYVTPGDEPSDADFQLVVANDTEDYLGRDSLD